MTDRIGGDQPVGWPATGGSTVRLYHDRSEHRTGALDAGDEEECFTAVGRRTGLWLTTEDLGGETEVSADVEGDVVGPYDVSGDEREHRVFVVPASVCSGWTFG